MLFVCVTANVAATGYDSLVKSVSWSVVFLRLTLNTSLGLALMGQAVAQSFSALHSFTPVYGPEATNTDGANPSAGLSRAGNALYGTAAYGGGAGRGTVFSINTDGSGFAAIYSFSGGADGANPLSTLVLSNNTLYGTASAGGDAGAGTVFSLSMDGTALSRLHSFSLPVNNGFGARTNGDGAYPYAGLLLSGGSLYGSANNGGFSGQGALFSVNTAGSVFTNLHSFSSGSGGAYSSAGLILLGAKLYGADYANLGSGTVFAVGTNGAGFTNYYAFSPGILNDQGILTNSDGANPHARLLFSANMLYGTTAYGGIHGSGTVFAISPDGTVFTTLHQFDSGAYAPSGLYTNSDGANPSSDLVVSGSHLYGTTVAGGRSGNGTLFMVNTDGSGFQTLYTFSATPTYPSPQTNDDGANPAGGLVLSDVKLYGATSSGGTAGNGTLFCLSFAPRLTIASSGLNVVLSWPSNAAGFDYSGFKLQTATLVGGPFTNIAGAISPFTDAAGNAQQYFRLSQ